jgi:hypothetical protein
VKLVDSYATLEIAHAVVLSSVKFMQVYSTRSKGHVREEHEPLTFEQTRKTCISHPTTRSKGLVHQEQEPLNDEQAKNT